MYDLGTLAIGAVAAFLASFVGSFVGGGSSLIMFTLLLLFVDGSYVELFTINKIEGLVMTIVAASIHYKKHDINVKFLGVIIAFSLVGTIFGTYLLKYQLNEELFKKILSGVIFMVATYLFSTKKLGLGKSKPRKITGGIVAVTGLLCLVIGSINGIFGGVGIFLTLYLVIVMKYGFIRAIAYTMMSFLVVNFIQVGYLVSTVDFDFKLAGVVIVAALVGAFMGTKFQYLKGNLWIKRGVVFFMLVIGTRLLLG